MSGRLVLGAAFAAALALTPLVGHAANNVVEQQHIAALTTALKATIDSLPSQSDEATFEAQLAATISGADFSCVTEAAALTAVAGYKIPADAAKAARALLPIVSRCELGQTGAVAGPAGGGLVSGPAFAGGGGGSNYRTQ